MGNAYIHPRIPSLPKFRVVIDEPFTVTGTDYAGPLLLKTIDIDIWKNKAFILLLTCALPMVVPLELVRDLTALSCVQALYRFIARRGCLR